MYRKLKIKFIAISTLSVLIVLLLVLGLVNYITYSNSMDDIYSTLEFISDQGGNPEAEKSFDKNYKGNINAETQYETRYLFLTYDMEGTYLAINDDHIAAISDEDIELFIGKALKSKDDRGLFTFNGLNYAYLKASGNGYSKLTIMDCTRYLATVHFFAKFSVYIGIVSILLTMLIVSIFSRRIVSPYVKNAEAQKQFITNASHELKTPLAVISANTEVIEMTCGKSEWTESTVNQVNRMSDLISQLVVLSRLEEREDIVLTDVNFSEEAKKSVANYKTIADTKGLSLEANVEEDIHINGDEKGVYELVNILLDNAVKYCDEGGVVELSLEKKGRNAILTVSNDYLAGDGVDYKRFFDRFYREDKSHNSEKKGYGIGLSMAESLVRMFKGKISVFYKKPKISFQIVLGAQ